MISREQQIKIISRNVKLALVEIHKVGISIKPRDFADAADLAPSTIDRILEAESMPSGQTISKLAKALWCEPGDLLPTLEELKANKKDSLRAAHDMRVGP